MAPPRTASPHGRKLEEATGLLLLLLTIVFVLALVSYRGEDPTWFHHADGTGASRNWMGSAGGTLAEALLQVFGLSALLLPVVLAGVGWSRFRGRSAARSYGTLVGHAVLVPSLCSLLDTLYRPILYGGESFPPGGMLGAWCADGLRAVLNNPGALAVSAAVLAGSIVLTTHFSFARSGEAAFSWLGRAAPRLASLVAGLATGTGASLRARWSARREERAREAQKRAMVKKHSARAADRARAAAEETASERRASIPLVGSPDPAPPPSKAPAPRVVATAAAAPKPAPKQPPLPLEAGEGGFSLPPLELLREPEAQAPDDEKELLERAQQLTQKFREFAVEGVVVAIHPGPVVTTFEFKPDAGVKYSKITGLVDDLCLALKAESVRIDRMPGRSTVGIEVPNRKQETIFPRELIASEKYQRLPLEADDGARQGHRRGGVRRRARPDAAPADRGRDRCGKVGRPERDDREHPVQGDARSTSASS